MKKIIFALIAVLLCCPMMAKPKKAKKSKKEVEVVKVDTIDSKYFAYLYGHMQTRGLREYLVQQKGVDTTYMAAFIEGFNNAELTEQDKIVKARLAGKEIALDVQNRMIPYILQQVEDSTFHTDIFMQGFIDALCNQPMGIPEDSASTLVNKQMSYYHGVQMEKKYGANRKAGEEFLANNAKEEGVKTTDSGLQYKIITAGTGEIPTRDQRVKVNYEGRLIDGTVFDSSYKRKAPATFGCAQVIKGWTEALTMMPVGSKWELYIPQQLAYGDREQQKIPPYSVLVFTVELLEIVK